MVNDVCELCLAAPCDTRLALILSIRVATTIPTYANTEDVLAHVSARNVL